MGALPGAGARGGGQALLVGLMVLAFIVLVIARTQSPAAANGAVASPSGGAAAESTSPGPAGSQPAGSPSTAPSPGTSPGPTPEPSPVATPAPTAKPTAKPTPKPTEAAASREYRVKSGDTLSSIAARFRVTVEALVTLNDIADPRYIRTGQVLRIP
jgi:LysM repeat protein